MTDLEELLLAYQNVMSAAQIYIYAMRSVRGNETDEIVREETLVRSGEVEDSLQAALDWARLVEQKYSASHPLASNAVTGVSRAAALRQVALTAEAVTAMLDLLADPLAPSYSGEAVPELSAADLVVRLADVRANDAKA